jgi:hypothetical protein
MNALHAKPTLNRGILGCVPFGGGDMRMVPDSRNKFAIDPIANAQRYPKNEQPK